VLAANPATLPLTARFKKFFAQRTLAESTRLFHQRGSINPFLGSIDDCKDLVGISFLATFSRGLFLDNNLF